MRKMLGYWMYQANLPEYSKKDYNSDSEADAFYTRNWKYNWFFFSSYVCLIITNDARARKKIQSITIRDKKKKNKRTISLAKRWS